MHSIHWRWWRQKPRSLPLRPPPLVDEPSEPLANRPCLSLTAGAVLVPGEREAAACRWLSLQRPGGCCKPGCRPGLARSSGGEVHLGRVERAGLGAYLAGRCVELGAGWVLGAYQAPRNAPRAQNEAAVSGVELPRSRLHLQL